MVLLSISAAGIAPAAVGSALLPLAPHWLPLAPHWPPLTQQYAQIPYIPFFVTDFRTDLRPHFTE